MNKKNLKNDIKKQKYEPIKYVFDCMNCGRKNIFLNDNTLKYHKNGECTSPEIPIEFREYFIN